MRNLFALSDAFRKRLCLVTMPVLMTALHLNFATKAKADWSANVGYHNPVGSTYGLNLLWFGKNWAFEIGAGWVDLNADIDEDDDDNDTNNPTTDNDDDDEYIGIGGDLDFKYLFRLGGFRPYLQGGVGWGASESIGQVDAGRHHGIGGPFIGAGIFLIGSKVYAYGSANMNQHSNAFFQGGLGLMF